MSTSPLVSGASRGQRLSFGGSLCTVQYVGPVNGQGNKIWLGVEWDNDLRGKHNGTYNGKEYFKC
jgi:dynactin complex subunit